MKQCRHTFWLGLSSQVNETQLLISNKLGSIASHVPNPDSQHPSLFVFIGNTAKFVALRELFSVKRSRGIGIRRNTSEIHLHVDPSSIFRGRPLLIAEGNLCSSLIERIPEEKCHEIRRRPIQRPERNLERISRQVYTELLYPFADVFCFFADDLGGFRQVAGHLVQWVEHHNTLMPRGGARPRVVIVTEEIPVGPRSEKQAEKAFVKLLREEIGEDLSQQISSVDVVALFPRGSMSVGARHRLLKERLMSNSDQVRKRRADSRYLFSIEHFAALLDCACEHFANTRTELFEFIQASRIHNPVATDLQEHISNFLRHIKTAEDITNFAAPFIASSFLLDSYPPDAHSFNPTEIFQELYQEVFSKGDRAMVFEESNSVMLRSGFISLIRKYFEQHFKVLVREVKPAAEIHRNTIRNYIAFWRNIKSTSTCLSCLRRRPRHGLPCGHMICEICVQVFRESSLKDPTLFPIKRCLLCEEEIPEGMDVRIHPPTAGAGILCLDGGGVRGIGSLELLKRIQDEIDLPIPFQRLFRVAFGISSGGLILADIFLNGQSIDKSTERFVKLAKLAFQPRKVLNIPLLPRILNDLISRLAERLYPFPLLFRFLELLISYFTDGLYPSEHIEAALKQAFGTRKSILDFSHATSSGTLVGLPVATVNKNPSCCIFTNYNGVGYRREDRDHVIKPKDGLKALLWEIARAASAAPAFFPPKHITGIGTFQDAGPLENDPLVSALSEFFIMFPFAEEPDWLCSVGNGELALDSYISTDDSRDVRVNGALRRLCQLFEERMRERKTRQIFLDNPRYHRLNIQFDDKEPRLDDTQSIPEVAAKARKDGKVSTTIRNMARGIIASFFYFELDSIPERFDGNHVGHGRILCSLPHGDPAFRPLFDQLSRKSAQFLIDGNPIAAIDDAACFANDGNFCKHVQLKTPGRFMISLKQGFSEPYNISGSPFTVERLISAQGLRAVFGRPDHRKRKCLDDVVVSSRKRGRTR